MKSFIKENLNSKTVMGALIGAIAVVTVTVIGSITSCSGTARENERLKERVASIERVLADSRAQVGQLQNELTPFKTVAYQRYGAMDTESMKKLADTLLSVKRDIDELNEKTSQIRLLPDGSVRIGGAVLGEPEKLQVAALNARNAYNEQRFSDAYRYATNYLSVYEKTRSQELDACFRVSRFNIPFNTAFMLSITAEESMSRGDYSNAVKKIESAIALHNEPYFNATKTALLFLLDQMAPANGMLGFYKTKPEEERRVYYGALLKWGYISKFNFPGGYDAIKKEFDLNFNIETPMEFCMGAQMKDGKTHETYVFMLWTGLGTFKPINYDNKILDKQPQSTK